MEMRGDFPGALDAYRSGLAILQKLVARDPSNTVWRRRMGWAHSRVANALLRMNRLKEAEESVKASLDVLVPIQEKQPTHQDARLSLAFARIVEGRLLAALRDASGARAAWEDAVELASPSVNAYGLNLTGVPHSIALLLLGREEEARPFLELYARKGRMDPEAAELMRQKGVEVTK